MKKDEYYLLTLEFNGKETNDSKFASYIDKLEMILQMKLYEEQGFSNMYSDRITSYNVCYTKLLR